MAKSKKCFIVFFLAVIFSAWLPFSGGTVFGEGPVRLKSITLETLFMKSAQPSIEAVWNRIFGFRNGLVLLKNTLYSAFNFGRFHAGSAGLSTNRVLQGKNGRLFYEVYFRGFFCPDKAALGSLIDGNIQAVKALQERMTDYGIPVLFVLEPSKTGLPRKYWPFMWRNLYQHSRHKIDPYALYQKALSDAGIPVLNLHQALMSHGRDPDAKYYWPRAGSHWTAAGAGAVLPELADFFSRHLENRLASPEKRQIAFSAVPFHREQDLSETLNVLFNGDDEGKYPYYTFKGGAGQTSLTWYGDSYGRQILRALVTSGLALEKDVIYFENRILANPPSVREVFDSVERSRLLVLGYTQANLIGKRIQTEAAHYLKQLDAPDFSEGWHPAEPGGKHWASEMAVTRFLSDGKRDYVLKMRLENKMPKIGSFSASLNGQSLGDVTVHGKIGQTLEIPLPKALLKKGVNSVRFDIPQAARPVSLSLSKDERIRSLYVSHLEIRPAKTP